MTDTCRITRPSAEEDATVWSAPDPTTGVVTKLVADTTVFEGKCWISASTASAPSVSATYGSEEIREGHRGRFPLTLTDLRVGDLVEILTSRHDPTLVGMTFTVSDVRSDSNAVTRLAGLRTITRTDTIV